MHRCSVKKKAKTPLGGFEVYEEALRGRLSSASTAAVGGKGGKGDKML